MTAPCFDVEALSDHLAELRDATHSHGCIRIRHPLFPATRCAEALSLAATFFNLPAEQKQRLAIERSPHFRGYSVMHNPRDWREQIHFGREESPQTGAACQQLRGPNLWPPDDRWRREILRLMADLETVGRAVLSALAASLGLPRARFLPADEVPYVLLKLIHYQPLPNSAPRSGVAPHVDFSWITLLLQDDAAGLEIRARDGTWTPAPPVPGTLLVNAGEILQFAAGGYYPATPHRVVNRGRSRLSLPFFLNPGLETLVEPVRPPSRHESDRDGHVHRVFSEPRPDPFVFGEQEWLRKGLGRYCGSCCRPGITPSTNAPGR